MTGQRLGMAKRILICTGALVLACWLPLAAQAQTPGPLSLDDPAAIPTAVQLDPGSAPLTADQLSAAAERAEELYDRIEQKSEEAYNFLQLFELLVGFMVTLALAFGAIGGWQVIRSIRAVTRLRGEMVRRYEQEREELNARFRELEDRVQARLDRLHSTLGDEIAQSRAQITEQADVQRHQIENALIAASLLPVGVQQYVEGNFTGARDAFLRAIELDESNPIAHYKIGYVYVHQDELEEAERHLKRALALEPDFPPAQATLGYTYRKKADRLRKQVELDANNPEDMMHASADMNMLYSMAESLLVSTLKASPRLLDEDGESWWGSLGGLYRRRGQIDLAIGAYKRAAECTPYSSYPFGNLALLMVQSGKLAEARSYFRQMEHIALREISADNNNFYGYADLLTAQLAQGNFTEATATMDDMLRLSHACSALSDLADTLKGLIDGIGDNSHAHQIARFVVQLEEAYDECMARQTREAASQPPALNEGKPL
jgi:tetratricopeptide (TPR) repeat protein